MIGSSAIAVAILAIENPVQKGQHFGFSTQL